MWQVHEESTEATSSVLMKPVIYTSFGGVVGQHQRVLFMMEVLGSSWLPEILTPL